MTKKKVKAEKVRLPAERLVELPDEQPSQNPKWEHLELWQKVRECIYQLPDTFRLDVELPTLPASDLPAANTLLGTTIEDHIPVALNRLRNVGDRDNKYPAYVFKRQPQSFPDVVFVRPGAENETPLFGIEVKGWYLLAKEMEPSFRMTVAQGYCNRCDLAVVVPWALSSAISGTVRLFKPLVISARTAARIRNEHWEYKNRKVRLLKEPNGGWKHYRSVRDEINDAAVSDKGKNFGRIARTGIWDHEISTLLEREDISGIPLKAWHHFLKHSSSGKDPIPAIEKLIAYYERVRPKGKEFGEVLEALDLLLEAYN